jgi:hypothetical protein
VRFANIGHPNRSSVVNVIVSSAEGDKTLTINEQTPSPLENNMISLGVYRFDPATPGAVTVSTRGVNGNVAVNAVQVLPAK